LPARRWFDVVSPVFDIPVVHRQQSDDGVDVVGHDDELVRLHASISAGQFVPHGLDHATGGVQFHIRTSDATEQTNVPLRADGHEIPTRLRVIVPGQTNRPAVMFFRIV
jgi:hypothetical protein